MTKIKWMSVVAMVLMPLGVAHAGFHSKVEVTIEPDDDGDTISAYANLADVYNSHDDNQLLGCGGNERYGWCQANTAPGRHGNFQQVFCTTQDPALLTQIRSIAADSFVDFVVAPSTGECISIHVSHQSMYAPKNTGKLHGE